jgi:pyruvate formate lyase activating enzyme
MTAIALFIENPPRRFHLEPMNKPQSAPLREAIAGVPGRYWERLADGRIQCDLCPRYCKLHDDQRGLCFVRARRGDEILLTTYGRSSGFCIDPIEKKPLNHFLPGTPVLSFGTAGCNLTCKFCQNWDISKARSFDRLQSEASPEAIVSAARATGSRAIAYTYNDPVIFLEYAVDVARAARAQDIKNVAVTAGYISEKAREEFFSAMDAANIDLKAFTEGFYRQLCSAELGPVLDTLEYVKRETSVWLEITTLLIPGCNDSSSEVAALSEWVASRLGLDVPLHFSAFHPDWKMHDVSATPRATLTRAREIARKAGLRHVYTGNVHDEAGQSTYCHVCGARVIGRDWYEITSWALDDNGCCCSCGARCAGVFEESHGSWGARRTPIEFGVEGSSAPSSVPNPQAP